MYNNILLLVDCSSVDEAIVSHIKELARIHNSRVHLFHVVHAHTLDQERIMLKQQNASFSKISKELEEAGIQVDYSSAEGEPDKLVLEKALEPEWDLIALATHGHKGLSDFIFGSVSDILKHKLHKPLLILRG